MFEKFRQYLADKIRPSANSIHQDVAISSTTGNGQPAKPAVAAPIRRDTKNPKYIDEAKGILGEASGLISDMESKLIGIGILGRYAELSDYVHSVGDNSSIESVYQIINYSGSAEMRSHMESAIDQAMERLVNVYRDFADMTFAAVPDASDMQQRFSLTPDLIAQEKSKGVFALKHNLSAVYTELAELASMQDRLKSRFPGLKQIVEESRNYDWGSFFRSFGGGALATINPFIGIPAILINIFSDSKKRKQQEQFIQEFCEMYQRYLQQWDKIRSLYMPVWEKQKQYMTEKTSHVIETSIPKILGELDRSGYSLKRVPAQYQEKLAGIKNEMSEFLKPVETATTA